ncbi:MAG: hypothetical protein DRG69_04100 [Deltaproteobacteria bacterium]|nr:MAG: hypothetical protein DRG69_04100 [Deltaproteobacteria bacterium]
MSKNSDLAIIIPIRNTPIYLINRCLESVFSAVKYARKYDVEVIAIDDCSDKRHYERYSSYIKNTFPDLIIRRSEIWMGIGGARNIGANLSNAKYLLFIDSDDILRKNAITTLMEHSSEKKVVFANHIRVGNNSTVRFNKKIFLEILKESYKIIDSPFLYTNFICMPAIIPKSLFTQIGGYPKQIYSGEHVALYGKLYFESDLKEIIYIDKVLYEYHPRENGNCFSNLKQHVAGKCDQFKILARTLGLNVVDYISLVSKHNLPSLYIPIFSGGECYIPSWAKIENGSWTVKKELIGYYNRRQATSYNRRVSGSLHCVRSTQIPSLRSGTSDTHQALYERLANKRRKGV